VDLERDLDEVEAFRGPLGMKSSALGGNGPISGAASAAGDDEADDDPGED